MLKKSFIICGMTVIAGIFGAFSRWLQLTTAFEKDTGLTIPFSLWSIVTAIWLAVCAGGIFLVVRGLKKRELTTGTQYPEAFVGAPALCNAAAFVSLVAVAAGGLLTFFSAMQGNGELIDLIGGAFAVVAAFCVFVLLRGANSKKSGGSAAAFVITIIYICFRLIVEYKSCAADPVLWNFAIRILAISAIILAYYYLSGFDFDSPKPFRAIYFSLLSIFLNVITFADSMPLAYHMTTAGLLMGQLALTILLIGNMVPETRPDLPREPQADADQ